MFSVSEVSVVECVKVSSGCGLHSVYSRLRSVVKQVKERRKKKLLYLLCYDLVDDIFGFLEKQESRLELISIL